MKIIIKMLMLCLLVFTVSCGNNEPTTQKVEEFELKKYRGFVVEKFEQDGWTDKDWCIIKNDSIIIELIVPAWFKDIYRERDTIK